MSVIEHEKIEVREGPTELDEIGKVLLKAAEIIRRSGLLKGDVGVPGGPRCTIGAVGEATCHFARDLYRQNDLRDKALRRLELTIGVPFIQVWSDAQDDAEHVALSYERTAYFPEAF